MQTKPVSLDYLYLDPNNFRLRSNPRYAHVSEEAMLRPAIQKRAMTMLTTDGTGVRDLIESFKSNGFLKVDNILARKISENAYLVIEGNRRVTALKMLRDDSEKGYDIGKISTKFFDEIEVVEYMYTDELDYKILMGLKHVSGNKKWDIYNQAKLIVDLESSGTLQQAEIAKKLAVDKSIVTRYSQAYHAIQEFIKYVDGMQLNGFNAYDKFAIFDQLVAKPDLREWIGWDQAQLKFTNIERRDRLFGWILPRKSDEIEENSNAEPLPPIIVSHKQIRQLAEIIEDDESLDVMERTGSLDTALQQNLSYAHSQLSKTLQNIERALNAIPIGVAIDLTDDDVARLNKIEGMIKRLVT